MLVIQYAEEGVLNLTRVLATIHHPSDLAERKITVKNKMYILLAVLLALGLLLGACGPVSVGIGLPGPGGSGGETQSLPDTTMLYLLIGAGVLIALVAMSRKS